MCPCTVTYMITKNNLPSFNVGFLGGIAFGVEEKQSSNDKNSSARKAKKLLMVYP